jgi:hypothetical protein
MSTESMETHRLGGSGFQFSATKLSQLGATEYTLFGLAVDVSGSVGGFGTEIEACLKSVIESCSRSPRADNLQARVVLFNHHLTELHGFKPLADCHTGTYTGKVQPGGGTALYDACATLVDSVAAYGKQLIDQDYSANGIVVIITDGLENGNSTLTVNAVKAAIENARKGESLESVVSILIGVNVTDPMVASGLQSFKDLAGFTQYVELSDASPKTLARLAGFISKSVSSQSQSLGTKAASQPITF